MNVQTEHRILAAERMTDSVIVMFSDDKCALFSASLLHDTLPQAELLDGEIEQIDA